MPGPKRTAGSRRCMPRWADPRTARANAERTLNSVCRSCGPEAKSGPWCLVLGPSQVLGPRWQVTGDRVGSLLERPALDRDPGLSDQVNRAALSVVLNIAEGF